MICAPSVVQAKRAEVGRALEKAADSLLDGRILRQVVDVLDVVLRWRRGCVANTLGHAIRACRRVTAAASGDWGASRTPQPPTTTLAHRPLEHTSGPAPRVQIFPEKTARPKTGELGRRSVGAPRGCPMHRKGRPVPTLCRTSYIARPTSTQMRRRNKKGNAPRRRRAPKRAEAGAHPPAGRTITGALRGATRRAKNGGSLGPNQTPGRPTKSRATPMPRSVRAPRFCSRLRWALRSPSARPRFVRRAMGRGPVNLESPQARRVVRRGAAHGAPRSAATSWPFVVVWALVAPRPPWSLERLLHTVELDHAFVLRAKGAQGGSFSADTMSTELPPSSTPALCPTLSSRTSLGDKARLLSLSANLNYSSESSSSGSSWWPPTSSPWPS